MPYNRSASSRRIKRLEKQVRALTEAVQAQQRDHQALVDLHRQLVEKTLSTFEGVVSNQKEFSETISTLSGLAGRSTDTTDRILTLQESLANTSNTQRAATKDLATATNALAAATNQHTAYIRELAKRIVKLEEKSGDGDGKGGSWTEAVPDLVKGAVEIVKLLGREEVEVH